MKNGAIRVVNFDTSGLPYTNDVTCASMVAHDNQEVVGGVCCLRNISEKRFSFVLEE